MSSNLKKQPYLPLFRSHLCYYSQVWRPGLIKHIVTRSGTSSTQFNEMHTAQLCNWLQNQASLRLPYHWCTARFFKLCIQYDTQLRWNAYRARTIFTFISFFEYSIRAGNAKRLQHKYCSMSISCHFSFNHVDLLWNLSPVINLMQSSVLSMALYWSIYGITSTSPLILQTFVS